MIDKIKLLVDHLDLPQDVIDIIHSHLQGYYQGRRCANEILLPHFQRSLTNIRKKQRYTYHRIPNLVHPGRDLIRIIRPRVHGFNTGEIRPFDGERVNIHGLSHKKRFYGSSYDLDCTHDDLNTVLTLLGAKKFKSKIKNEKIKLLLKY